MTLLNSILQDKYYAYGPNNYPEALGNTNNSSIAAIFTNPTDLRTAISHPTDVYFAQWKGNGAYALYSTIQHYTQEMNLQHVFYYKGIQKKPITQCPVYVSHSNLSACIAAMIRTQTIYPGYRNSLPYWQVFDTPVAYSIDSADIHNETYIGPSIEESTRRFGTVPQKTILPIYGFRMQVIANPGVLP